MCPHLGVLSVHLSLNASKYCNKTMKTPTKFEPVFFIRYWRNRHHRHEYGRILKSFWTQFQSDTMIVSVVYVYPLCMLTYYDNNDNVKIIAFVSLVFYFGLLIELGVFDFYAIHFSWRWWSIVNVQRFIWVWSRKMR